jgi:hypothetical protein
VLIDLRQRLLLGWGVKPEIPPPSCAPHRNSSVPPGPEVRKTVVVLAAGSAPSLLDMLGKTPFQQRLVDELHPVVIMTGGQGKGQGGPDVLDGLAPPACSRCSAGNAPQPTRNRGWFRSRSCKTVRKQRRRRVKGEIARLHRLTVNAGLYRRPGPQGSPRRAGASSRSIWAPLTCTGRTLLSSPIP